MTEFDLPVNYKFFVPKNPMIKKNIKLLAEIEKNRLRRTPEDMIKISEVVFNKKNHYELKGE